MKVVLYANGMKSGVAGLYTIGTSVTMETRPFKGDFIIFNEVKYLVNEVTYNMDSNTWYALVSPYTHKLNEVESK